MGQQRQKRVCFRGLMGSLVPRLGQAAYLIRGRHKETKLCPALLCKGKILGNFHRSCTVSEFASQEHVEYYQS